MHQAIIAAAAASDSQLPSDMDLSTDNADVAAAVEEAVAAVAQAAAAAAIKEAGGFANHVNQQSNEFVGHLHSPESLSSDGSRTQQHAQINGSDVKSADQMMMEMQMQIEGAQESLEPLNRGRVLSLEDFESEMEMEMELELEIS
jgi:hypothetical protein